MRDRARAGLAFLRTLAIEEGEDMDEETKHIPDEIKSFMASESPSTSVVVHDGSSTIRLPDA